MDLVLDFDVIEDYTHLVPDVVQTSLVSDSTNEKSSLKWYEPGFIESLEHGPRFTSGGSKWELVGQPMLFDLLDMAIIVAPIPNWKAKIPAFMRQMQRFEELSR